MIPDRIGPYLIEKKVGAGGMGTVYKAVHEETNQAVALKVLPASLAREEGFVARFEREVHAMKKLHNPHVVEFYESGVEGETYYYAMEFVEGETLTTLIRRQKRIPWRETIDYTIQICAALKAAHDAGIIHRDLKPSNLLVTPEGHVKLTDFGVAQVFAGTRLTSTGGVIGTAEFMSPEQAQGKRATKKSDLYALGAVMYVMVTGRAPFHGKTGVDVMHQHLYGQFDRPIRIATDMPHWLDDIICQLMEKDPDKRIPDALVLSRRLEEIKRKVDLSQTLEQTRVANTGIGSRDTKTAGDFELNSGAGGDYSGPGEATLMRDFMKAEIENANKESAIGRFFNNTFVLITLLALLILGGVLWFKQAPTEEERFAKGMALMEQGEGENFLEARREYFNPLLEKNPEEWKEKIQPELEKIRLYELKRELGINSKRRGKSTPHNEAERLLMLAQEYQDQRNFPRAERVLSSLIHLLADNPAYQELHEIAAMMLEDVHTLQQQQDDLEQLLESALARAERVQQEQPAEAREIRESLITLYQDDPRAAEYVQRAKSELSSSQGNP